MKKLKWIALMLILTIAVSGIFAVTACSSNNNNTTTESFTLVGETSHKVDRLLGNTYFVTIYGQVRNNLNREAFVCVDFSIFNEEGTVIGTTTSAMTCLAGETIAFESIGSCNETPASYALRRIYEL